MDDKSNNSRITLPERPKQLNSAYFCCEEGNLQTLFSNDVATLAGALNAAFDILNTTFSHLFGKR